MLGFSISVGLRNLSDVGTPLQNGLFIVGLVSASGLPTYYGADFNMFKNFMDFIFSDEFLRTVSSGWSQFDESWKTKFNPLEYITSVIWLPLAPGTLLSLQKIIHFEIGRAHV